MSGIIPKILGLHEDIIKRGTLFYVRVLIPMVFFLLLMFAIGFLFNIAGYKGANLIFSLILTLLMVLLAARPEAVINIFLAGAISGAVQPGHTMSGEVEKFFLWYTGLVTQVMLWTSIIFLFLGTVSAKGRFNALVGIIATVVLLQLIQAVWKIGRSWGKQFVYLWAVVFLGYFVLQSSGFLPQAEYYVNRWTSGIEIISGGEAARIKKLEDIRNRQRSEMVERAYEKAEKWQIANPGRDIPKDIEMEIQAAKKGLTVEELKLQQQAEAKAQKKSNNGANEAPLKKFDDARLVQSVIIGKSQFPQNLHEFLPPGKYTVKFEPEGAAFGAKLCIQNRGYEETGKYGEEDLQNNFISIKDGEKGFAIWTPIPSIVRIYAQ
ncbi:MAG: hypothetical protein WA081_03515 [Desulfosalsimonadaceae bacterium]